MIRSILPGFGSFVVAMIFGFMSSPTPVLAHSTKATAAKPFLVATYGDWGAYAAKVGTQKECYALTQPKDREPSNLKRDPAYIFISDRPAGNVHNELSIIMGFDVKTADAAKKSSDKATEEVAEPTAEVGSEKFVLVAKGKDLWLENIAQQAAMIAAMRMGNKLIVQATSLRDHVTTDEYSLIGLSQALDRVKKECQ